MEVWKQGYILVTWLPLISWELLVSCLIDLCPPQVFEGYGQTECTAGATLTLPGDFGPGHVGPPLSCNIVKLVDVPDMNYFAANGEGEVSGIQLLSLLACLKQKPDSTALCPPPLPRFATRVPTCSRAT